MYSCGGVLSENEPCSIFPGWDKQAGGVAVGVIVNVDVGGIGLGDCVIVAVDGGGRVNVAVAGVD